MHYELPPKPEFRPNMLPETQAVLTCSPAHTKPDEMQRRASRTIVCSARHFVAAHESACTRQPVDFGAVCADCEYWDECRGNWLETAAPMFDAAGIHPKVLRPSAEQQL